MENDMKKLITIALLCGALLLSGCGDGELPLTKLELEQEQRIEELEAELEQAEARLAEAAEALAGAGEGAEYSLENMIRVEPEFSQAVVNCPEGILVSAVEPQLKCGHPMENEYVEVVAKCRVKLSSELTEPPEEWLLVECAVMDATEGSLGWIPAECAAEYTAENMEQVTWPLKVDESKLDWGYGLVSIGSVEDGAAQIGYHGGGSASIPLEALLRPEPGTTGWFE